MADKIIAIEIKVEGLDNVKLSTTELDKLAAVKARNRKESQDTAKAITAEAGSMAQLRAETSLLIQKANQLNTTTKQGAKEFEALQRQIVQNKEKIRDFDRQLSGSTTLVGEYERGFTGAFKNMGASILAMGGLIAGATGAFKVLSEAIKDNEAISEFLDRKVGGLSASFDVLKGKVLGFFESLLKNDNESSIKWGNGLRSILGAMTTGFSELIPGVRKLGDEMNDAAKANELIIKKQQELEDLEGKRILARSKANFELAKAKLLVNDLNVSEEEKAKALRNALKIENEILQEEIKHQESVIANQIAINDLKKKAGLFDEGREGLALAREQAKLNDLQTESFIRQRKAESAANKEESKALKEKLESDLRQWRIYFDSKGRLISEQVRDVSFNVGEESIKTIDNLTGEDAKFKLGLGGQKIKKSKVSLDPDGDALRKYSIQKTKEYNRERKRIEIETDEEIKQNKIASYQFAFSAIGNLANSLGSLFEANKQKELSAAGDNAKKRAEIEEKYAKKQQMIQIAQAITGTASGIINALTIKPAALVPYAIALASITGAIQLAVIKSQKLAKGGILHGPSHEQGGIPIRVNGQSGYEAEGGEAIINKRSTAKYRSILSKINQDGGGKKFALGGVLPEQTNAIGFDINAMSSIIANQINSIQVINNVGEFNKASSLHNRINTRQKI